MVASINRVAKLVLTENDTRSFGSPILHHLSLSTFLTFNVFAAWSLADMLDIETVLLVSELLATLCPFSKISKNIVSI